jgi:predicted PurR-regulated permease PerM
MGTEKGITMHDLAINIGLSVTGVWAVFLGPPIAALLYAVARKISKRK